MNSKLALQFPPLLVISSLLAMEEIVILILSLLNELKFAKTGICGIMVIFYIEKSSWMGSVNWLNGHFCLDDMYPFVYIIISIIILECPFPS